MLGVVHFVQLLVNDLDTNGKFRVREFRSISLAECD